MKPGKVIFLNGTSSAGKTSLSHALQEVFHEPYIHVALDQFRDGLPDKYRGLNAPPNTTGHEGLNVVPVTDSEKPFTAIKFGSAGVQMLKGMRRAMAAMVESGNNIIVDDILLEPEFLEDYVRVFAPFDVIFVGVRCPLGVINAREIARPGRFPGTAYGHFDACHAHAKYDLEVDTSQMSPSECAQSVFNFVQNENPSVFKHLATCP